MCAVTLRKENRMEQGHNKDATEKCFILCMQSFFLSIHLTKKVDTEKNQRRVINTSLAVFTITIIFYLLWNYVILEIIGIAIGLPWEESAFWN